MTVKHLARDTLFEVNEGTEMSPSWTEIKGINSFSVAPTTNKPNTTTFDTNGALEHVVASRGWSITLNGFRLEDPNSGDRDPGQLAVEDLGRSFGVDARGHFRVTSPGGEIGTFFASVEAAPMGGGNDDPNSWSVTLERTGEDTWTPAGT